MFDVFWPPRQLPLRDADVVAARSWSTLAALRHDADRWERQDRSYRGSARGRATFAREVEQLLPIRARRLAQDYAHARSRRLRVITATALPPVGANENPAGLALRTRFSDHIYLNLAMLGEGEELVGSFCHELAHVLDPDFTDATHAESITAGAEPEWHRRNESFAASLARSLLLVHPVSMSEAVPLIAAAKLETDAAAKVAARAHLRPVAGPTVAPGSIFGPGSPPVAPRAVPAPRPAASSKSPAPALASSTLTSPAPALPAVCACADCQRARPSSSAAPWVHSSGVTINKAGRFGGHPLAWNSHDDLVKLLGFATT